MDFAPLLRGGGPEWVGECEPPIPKKEPAGFRDDPRAKDRLKGRGVLQGICVAPLRIRRTPMQYPHQHLKKYSLKAHRLSL